MIAAFVLFAGCGASVPSSRWRDDAAARFNTVLSAGSESFAPEETDNIRQTLLLADRYFKSNMIDDADRLYQLSCQKTQLLYRNLVVSKIRAGTALSVEKESDKSTEKLVVAEEPVSIARLIENENAQQEDEEEADEEEADSYAVDTMNKGSLPQTAGTDIPAPEQKTQDVIPIHSVSDAATMTAGFSETSPVPVKKTRKTPAPQKSQQTRTGTTLYLTFDDGPSTLTLPIARYLQSQGVRATFFALGSNIKGRETIVSSVAAMGHQVGNHTLSHNLHKLNASLANRVNEVSRTAAMIDRLGGDGKLVRIPYGASNKKIAATVAAEGAQIFDWDINSNDSTHYGAKRHQVIEQTVLTNLRAAKKRHLVLLFHDGAGHQATLTAIKSLIPRLKQEGYRFGLLARQETIAAASAGRSNRP